MEPKKFLAKNSPKIFFNQDFFFNQIYFRPTICETKIFLTKICFDQKMFNQKLIWNENWFLDWKFFWLKPFFTSSNSCCLFRPISTFWRTRGPSQYTVGSWGITIKWSTETLQHIQLKGSNWQKIQHWLHPFMTVSKLPTKENIWRQIFR